MRETREQRFDKIIEVKNVTKVFDDVTVIDDINLSIRRGQFVTLLGPSGCGKTTLLRMIAGFTLPTSGNILIEGQDVTQMPPYRRPVNTVFQKYALFPHLNVFKNVAFGLKLKKLDDGVKTDKKGNTVKKTRKLTKSEIADKVNHALKMVGLEDYGHRDVNSLSGGQQPCGMRLRINSKKVQWLFRAVSSKGWLSRALLSASLKFCSWTNLWEHWTSKCAKTCRSSL